LGVAEMIRLGQAMGARIETMMGLSGLGDLVLTCTDSQSRNRRFGLALGQKTAAETAEKTIGQAIEGKDNVAQVVVLAQKYHVNMPITETVLAILSGKEDAQKGLLKILAQ
jgi:glycerol-3-phosphate dehydrogenase (NAD(P)+)